MDGNGSIDFGEFSTLWEQLDLGNRVKVVGPGSVNSGRGSVNSVPRHPGVTQVGDVGSADDDNSTNGSSQQHLQDYMCKLHITKVKSMMDRVGNTVDEAEKLLPTVERLHGTDKVLCTCLLLLAALLTEALPRHIGTTASRALLCIGVFIEDRTKPTQCGSQI